jgi:hypothetical protein
MTSVPHGQGSGTGRPPRGGRPAAGPSGAGAAA